MTYRVENLLVVDWDTFFHNPIDGGDYKDEKQYPHPELFDWGHKESRFFIEMLWNSRAIGFLMNGLPLPRVNEEWRKFPDRFRFTDDAVMYYAESNMEAGNVTDSWGQPFKSVWLYDAHHDSGYGHKTMADFAASPEFSCEDWMLIHAKHESELHVRYPTWKKHWDKEQSPPEDLVIDRQMDAPYNQPDVEFSSVFICRSGAWVPSWEDDKFFEFVSMMMQPGGSEELGDYPCVDRKYNEAEVHKELEDLRVMMQIYKETK